MGVNFQDLIGGSVTDGVAKIISLFKVDPNAALQHQAELEKIQADMQSQALAAIAAASASQSDVDKIEAASPKTFIAGWRPFIGWVCGCAVASNFIVGPLCTWFSALIKHPVVFPQFDGGTLLDLLGMMLGLGGMRTYEKISGVQDTHIKD